MSQSFASYCIRCRRKTPSYNPKTVTFRNKRRAIKSSCGYCQVKKFRIIGHGGARPNRAKAPKRSHRRRSGGGSKKKGKKRRSRK